MMPTTFIALAVLVPVVAGVALGWMFRSRRPKRGGTNKAELERVRAQHQKLQEARRALERLEDKQVLGTNLEKTQSHLSAISKHNERFGAVLMAIEQRLALADPQDAEDVLITFAKHLRHVLHEGSIPFISVAESMDHLRTYLKLMGMLTGDRFDCFVDASADAPEIQGRLIESFLLTPWLEEWVWPMFELAERYPVRLPSMMISLRHSHSELTMSVHRPTSSDTKPWTRLTIPLLGSRQEVA